MASVFPTSTQAETIDCTAITSLPTTITTQGIYCLTGNLSTGMTSGNAIEIQTNNVTIDLNGYKLGGLGAGDTTLTNGIYAASRKNITIKNGIIRGFFRAIYLDDNASSGHVVKNILADQNTFAGILVYGTGNTVSNNTIVDTGGSTQNLYAYGIVASGPGAKVVNNDISQTTAQSAADANGIYLILADYCVILNNTITDTTKDTGSSYAIRIGNSAGVFLRNNQVANADFGIYFASSSGKYFNNLTFDISGTAFTGGTAIGGNNN